MIKALVTEGAAAAPVDAELLHCVRSWEEETATKAILPPESCLCASREEEEGIAAFDKGELCKEWLLIN